MQASIPLRALVFCGVAVVGMAVAIMRPAVVAAHHGWSWAVEEQSTLQGTIREISMVPPHPTLRVADAQGTVWQIDLGNPTQTAKSGFTAQSAKVGDVVIVLGNRHKDASRKQMKAVRITIDSKNYDMYPERIRSK